MNELSAEETNQLKDLIVRSNLDGIQFHEIHAKLHEGFSGQVSSTAKVDFQYQTRASENDFGVRGIVEVSSEAGDAKVAVAAEYSLEQGPAPNEKLLDLFASEVAIMTLFPYLREGIHSVTSRVFGVPLQLPVIQRGQFRNGTRSGS